MNERENLRKGTKEEGKKARFPGRSDLVREIIFFSKIFGEQQIDRLVFPLHTPYSAQ